LKAVDFHTESVKNLPAETDAVVKDVACIPDLSTQRQIAEAIRTMLKRYFDENINP